MPKHLLVRSVDRKHGSADSFFIEIPSFHGPVAVALLSASIPNTLYNIRPGFDTIYWTRAATPYSLTIPAGGWGVDELIVGLELLINGVDAGGVYKVIYTIPTMKLTITSTDATFSLTTSNRTNSAWDALGWQSTTNTAAGIAQVADSVIRLDYPSHLLVDIGLPGAEVVTTTWHRGNFIVPMTKISQYVEVYNRATSFSQLQCYSLGAGVSTLQIRLLRPDGTRVDLNGGEWTMLLGLECV